MSTPPPFTVKVPSAVAASPATPTDPTSAWLQPAVSEVTRIGTTDDVTTAPASSVALATRLYAPVPTLLQVTV